MSAAPSDDPLDEPLEEDALLTDFVSRVTEMLSRPDYLLPLAAGQRQYRMDSYNMASAAQLEDLFFDAFGRFLRENYPDEPVARRLGKELWDYSYKGLKISHKEALTKVISVWWTAGAKNADGKYVPQDHLQTYSSPHPIVMIYSGNHASSWDLTTDLAPARSGKFKGLLGNLALRAGSVSGNLLAGETQDDGTIAVLRTWMEGEWSDLTFDDIWPVMGGPQLLRRDLYLDQPFADRRRGLAKDMTAGTLDPEDLKLRRTTDGTAQPGIYAIASQQILDVPLVANNRAHSIDSGTVERLMQDAAAAGNYVPFPMWFAHFADAPPPNLYAQQRAQFEDLFVARRRD